MKFHDYHLLGYTVDSKSASITFKLSWPYDKGIPDETIIFTEVAGYLFCDSLGSILCNIKEIDIDEFIASKHQEDTSSFKAIGVPKYWRPSIDETLKELQGKRVWLISSAIGFEGYVVCGEVYQPESSKVIP